MEGYRKILPRVERIIDIRGAPLTAVPICVTVYFRLQISLGFCIAMPSLMLRKKLPDEQLRHPCSKSQDFLVPWYFLQSRRPKPIGNLSAYDSRGHRRKFFSYVKYVHWDAVSFGSSSCFTKKSSAMGQAPGFCTHPSGMGIDICEAESTVVLSPKRKLPPEAQSFLNQCTK